MKTELVISCYVEECSPTHIKGRVSPLPVLPAVLHAIIDGQELCQYNLPPDGGENGATFVWPMPDGLCDGIDHVIEFRHRLAPVRLFYKGQPVKSLDVCFRSSRLVRSYVDGVLNGSFSGWVLAEGEDGRLTGGHDVLVTCNGRVVGQTRASVARNDVGRALESTPFCGFEFHPPSSVRKPYEQEFRFFLLPEKVELTNSPYITSLVTDQQEGIIAEVIEAVDALHCDLTSLRRKIRQLSSIGGYNLARYSDWARTYFKALSSRVERDRLQVGQGPLVSIVCPVYKPDLKDFELAVESVLKQTYQHWELILIDDASRDKKLTDMMVAFTQRDPRIRIIKRARNGGISKATNAGLQKAQGEWIAFLDHDDLLVEVALEYMIREGQRTGALLLYSDEDKVDEQGRYLDPAFKPDWNYRLLLGTNYICHFVLVHRELVAQVGGFDSKYDGAQDHDFLLRVAEHIPASKVYHVPEILYHWRLARSSTSVDISNKPYAVQAGVAAVTDHLARRSLNATVTSLRGATLYQVSWIVKEEPSVTIIIPFKDQVATTKDCLAKVLQRTDYKNFKVLLVDNWSTTEEAAAFCSYASALPNVKVMTVRENFNFSRLNNLAAQKAKTDFLLFLNNDVLIDDGCWLSTLVNEAIVDKDVGIVGGKLVYPSGFVQHGGIILGVGGVAMHAHIGLGKEDPGYCARALFAQELSAVTAAAMLVRNSLFKEVGGFDEENLAIAYNDVDLCLKARKLGAKVVWNPNFCAEHSESLSRGTDDDPTKEARLFAEASYMVSRWGEFLKRDPFYNPHFSLDGRVFYDLSAPQG